ncbi:alpha-2 adrenergic receptor-like [Babylonia areolata]|uniref:alpha-2 adrenergic receptor-like n=1 Tax=Babylonia areolata TaxID=304850 RepID=UPI003FD225B0
MRTLLAHSAFRPPSFVSMSRGTVYALPQHVIPPPYRTAHPHPNPNPNPPVHTAHHGPSPLSSWTSNDSLVLSVHSVTNDDNGLGEAHVVWNVTDVNETTPASVTSTLTSEKPPPHFPAGYPSGYTWPHIVCASVIVTAVMLVIVVGNFLVMWAIVRDKNLKGTQNYFIGSLALADFLLGLLIVPFSLANELMGYWYFGTVFCEVWKAMDVLLCTASITSLCLISLDRYWSITKAIHYSRQRTPKRAAIMIFIVWFVSAAICIPPLIGWNQPAPDSDWPICTLSEDIGYVLYSSMGSFYIPAFIMVFVYFKIYQAAKARARKSVSKTPRVTQSERSEQRNSMESSGNDHQHVSQQTPGEIRLQCDSSVNTTVTQSLSAGDQHNDSDGKAQNPVRAPGRENADSGTPVSRCPCSTKETADDSLTSLVPRNTHSPQLDPGFRSRSTSLPCRTVVSNELTRLIVSTDSDSCETFTGPALNRVERSRSCVDNIPTTTTTDTDSSVDLTFVQPSSPPPPPTTPLSCNARSPPTESVPSRKGVSPINGSEHVTMRESVVRQDNGTLHHFIILEPQHNGHARKAALSKGEGDGGLFGSLRKQWLHQNNGQPGASRKKKGPKKVGRGEDFSSAERHKRKLAKARERRATLVLGLVMAAFILCWLPFFLLYVVSAFCVGCIPMMVFTVFFWIGYCNSALNPIIYTVFNRDFRRAFHRILFGRRQSWR